MELRRQEEERQNVCRQNRIKLEHWIQINEHKQLQIDPEVFNALPTQRERYEIYQRKVRHKQNTEKRYKKFFVGHCSHLIEMFRPTIFKRGLDGDLTFWAP